jgi:hypothetical protein
VQLAEKAMKLSSVTRRSQTPVFAVTPAHGSGEGSVTVTATVLPSSKSGLPTVTHFCGTFRKKGARINPTKGTPTIALQRPINAIESFSKKRRLLISSGVSANGVVDDSVRLVFMTKFCDPASERGGEESDADE